MSTEEIPPAPDFLPEDIWRHMWSTRSVEGQRQFSQEEVQRYLDTQGDTTSGFGDDLAFAFGGAPGMKMADNHLLLTVIGRTSGLERTTPLIFLTGENEGELVVVGSFAGLPNDPQWYRNLLVTPSAWVRIANERWPVQARIAEGAERQRLWAKVEQYFKLWAYFQKYCEREFPVVILCPSGPRTAVDSPSASPADRAEVT